MRTLCASTLIGEFFVIGFAALVAVRMYDVPDGTVWTVSGVAMALCVLLCGALSRPGAVPVGWVLQAALIASGVLVPVMFFLGACFAALWWASVHFGGKIDEAEARSAAGAGAGPAADGGAEAGRA